MGASPFYIDLSDRVAFEWRPDGNNGARHADNLRKNIPGKGNSKCKGPEVGMCLMHVVHHQQTGQYHQRRVSKREV